MTDAETLAAIRYYLTETENAGQEVAEALGIMQLAPGVFCVIDLYANQKEFDVYFDANVAAWIHPAARQSQPDRRGLTELGLDCLGFGPCRLGIDFIRLHAQENLALKDGHDWFATPQPMPAASINPSA